MVALFCIDQFFSSSNFSEYKNNKMNILNNAKQNRIENMIRFEYLMSLKMNTWLPNSFEPIH